MGRRPLGLGEHGEWTVTPQRRADGRWIKVPSDQVRKAERWRARCKRRGFDGVVVEVARVAATRRQAERALADALDDLTHQGDGMLTPGTLLSIAGAAWLLSIERPEAGKAARTVDDYRRYWERCIISPGSSVRGLTLAQVNDPQRLGGFLRAVADERGTGSAKQCRSVLTGILTSAVDAGVLPGNAMRQVGTVKARQAKMSPRDLTRAFTREERDHVVAHADKLAKDERADLNPRTRRKRETVADLIAVMAGTGLRIDEARSLLWEHVDLSDGYVSVHGTKTRAARRRVDLPPWLTIRLRDRAERTGIDGLVFASPGTGDPHVKWEQSNSAAAVREVLDGAGATWAVPHTFRRTVATLLHAAGVPIARIADQLGHADPAMTASIYLGRDFDGDKADLAAFL